MNTLKFKTNIKCGNCVAAVTPHINALSGIDSWVVDLKDPNRILTVKTDEADAETVKKAVETAGYKAEAV
ncbi:MAG TPA: heavy-metal-associated domain-containing protein [Spirosoma sp.]|jgi:copper chaperone CopZ|nr:heavy-metal-associated domain-containing protein [Spirosoma sp.]